MAEVPAAALPSIQVLPQVVGKTPSRNGKKTKAKTPVLSGVFSQLRGEDLNLRPSGYEEQFAHFRAATQHIEITHNSTE
jgi:hypothetical protein